MKRSILAAAASLAAIATPALAGPVTADIVTIVDESGSMAGEHAWLGGMITQLDTGLNTAGLIGNRFGLVGFGAGSTGGHTSQQGHSHLVGGGQFGTAAQFGTATGTLVTSGSVEDGYDGIDTANSYSYRSGAARNYILVTDEDRDTLAGNTFTYAQMLNSMTATNTLLNAVVNATFTCTGAGTGAVLGITAAGNGYRLGANGTFTTTTGCSVVSGFGTTVTDYVNLAIATGGAAWDLNQLRVGGNTALSFTNAFIDLKVQEITNQNPIPEPSSIALVAAALVGLGAARRRRTA